MGPEHKLEDVLFSYQKDKLRRDRMGPFLGQILQNISCTFDDATSTTTGNSGVASIESKPSTIKKEAYIIYRDKLSSLENKQRQEL